MFTGMLTQATRPAYFLILLHGDKDGLLHGDKEGKYTFDIIVQYIYQGLHRYS